MNIFSVAVFSRFQKSFSKKFLRFFFDSKARARRSGFVLRGEKARARARARAGPLKRWQHRRETRPARALTPPPYPSESARAVLGLCFVLKIFPRYPGAYGVMCFFLRGGVAGHCIEI